MRLLPLLCPLLLVLAFCDVLGSLSTDSAGENLQASPATVHVGIEKPPATSEPSTVSSRSEEQTPRLSTQQPGSIQLVLLVDGVEVGRKTVETITDVPVTAPADI